MQPEGAEAGKSKAMEELGRIYGLAQKENLRRIRPPFVNQRTVYADTEYPFARGSENLRSLGFTWAMPRRRNWARSG